MANIPATFILPRYEDGYEFGPPRAAVVIAELRKLADAMEQREAFPQTIEFGRKIGVTEFAVTVLSITYVDKAPV